MGIYDKTNHLEPLLEEDATFGEDTTCDEDTDASNQSLLVASRRNHVWALLGVSFLLISSNAMWIADRRMQFARQTSISSPRLSIVPKPMIEQPFFQETKYNLDDDENARSDQLWHDLFPKGNGVLSLPDSMSQAAGLPPAIPDRNRPDHSVYIVAGMHTLHCVTVIRNALYNYRDAKSQTQPWHHYVYCLDQIRQTLMCNFDSTILASTSEKGGFEDGVAHVCTDYWAIKDWMTEFWG